MGRDTTYKTQWYNEQRSKWEKGDIRKPTEG
jgi:hypothetical protein